MKIILNGFFIVISVLNAIAILQKEYSMAIWLVLFLLMIQFEQIHDTLKAISKLKETTE